MKTIIVGDVSSIMVRQAIELLAEEQQARKQHERLSKEIQQDQERLRNKKHRLLIRKLKSNCGY
ncbi:hypothetical protein [Cytobacillus sp. IB215665]|uniref:hypothetical protein n=1 Tax=Cytobacillus sp. IB215665 TaxID=3097357 RepID=UPI002A0FAC35|nr:hypothetical protein [Cytobacillus sp. IB215665]MDX8367315.1 hypothetical protein [Cytobacillus sp. IB215665]